MASGGEDEQNKLEDPHEMLLKKQQGRLKLLTTFKREVRSLLLSALQEGRTYGQLEQDYLYVLYHFLRQNNRCEFEYVNDFVLCSYEEPLRKAPNLIYCITPLLCVIVQQRILALLQRFHWQMYSLCGSRLQQSRRVDRQLSRYG